MTSTTRPLILRHADVVVTMDAQRREIADGGRWPGWNAGSEYGAVRARTNAARR